MVDAEKFWEAVLKAKPLVDGMVANGFGQREHAATLKFFSAAFDKYAPGVAFEFGVAGDGIFELVISAGGLRKNIPDVMQLVAAAPKFEKWHIMAFRPRQDLDFHIRIGNHECDIAKTRVLSKGRDDKFDVALFIDVPADAPTEILTQFQFLILDVALGEYDVVTQIGGVQGYPMASTPQGSSLPTISEFVAAFDKRFAGRPH